MSRYKITAWALIFSGWLLCSLAGAGTLSGIDGLPASFEGEPQLRLTGMFTYLADAAVITLCADGRQLPVAMEKDYIALEHAYLQADTHPGRPVLVSLEGLITQRPSMEATQPPRTTLVVEQFIAAQPHESCGNPLADTPLRGPRWNLVYLDVTPVTAAANPREAYLVFAEDTLHVSGSGGCNRFAGRFELDQNHLHFGPTASTRMVCPDNMDLEKQFLEALIQVAQYRICGRVLDLLDATGAVSLRFEAGGR